jgi:hypothetical protein
MEQQNWLPLIEYSNKHQISISTLRRRIKDNAVLFKLEEGKYFIADDSVEKATRGRKPIMIPNQGAPNFSAPKAEFISGTNFSSTQKNEVLEELKKAYLASLQSKEEQIFQLKEEVSDLKTLVRVLESENERLKKETDRFFANVRQY